MPQHKGGKKGTSKYGRDKKKGERYRAGGRREKNNPKRTRRPEGRTPH